MSACAPATLLRVIQGWPRKEPPTGSSSQPSQCYPARYAPAVDWGKKGT